MKTFYQEFKKPIIYILLILAGFFLYTKIAGPIPFYINSTITSKNDFFTAEGTGKAVGIPDIATVTVGVSGKGITVLEAQEKINSASKKITSAIKKLGIEEKNIETLNYNIYPEYNYNTYPVQISELTRSKDDISRITGYSATQNIQIKIKDIKKINNVIDAATKEGANIVNNVNFDFSDELKTQLENEARKKAINMAKQKAGNIAKLSGVRLGRLINVYESKYGTPYNNQKANIGGLTKEDDSSTPTELNPGEGTISVTITLSYETL